MRHDVLIHGIPRTKKTSGQGVVLPPKIKGGKYRAVMFPAADWRIWVKEARIMIDGLSFVNVKKSIPRLVPLAGEPRLWTPLSVPMNCAAVFYLGNRQHGDTLGYLQGLADLLQEREVVANDRHIITWDGSRVVHNGTTPRVEVTLTDLPLELT